MLYDHFIIIPHSSFIRTGPIVMLLYVGASKVNLDDTTENHRLYIHKKRNKAREVFIVLQMCALRANFDMTHRQFPQKHYLCSWIILLIKLPVQSTWYKNLFQSKSFQMKIIGKIWVMYKNMTKGKKSIQNWSPFPNLQKNVIGRKRYWFTWQMNRNTCVWLLIISP